MATKTESDYEADEEFQERISDELRTFYFPDFYDFACELEHELCKKRFDRAKKIIEIMVDKRNHNMYDPGDVSTFLGELTVIVLVFQLMPAAEPGCSETLQFMSSHFGLGGYVSDRVQKRMAVRQASQGSVEATTVWTLSAFLPGIPSLDVLAAGCVAHSSKLRHVVTWRR